MEQQNLNITLDKTTAVTCECENETFIEGVLLRKASRFVTGTSKDALIPIPTFICAKCGEVLEETLPTELKNKNND